MSKYRYLENDETDEYERFIKEYHNVSWSFAKNYTIYINELDNYNADSDYYMQKTKKFYKSLGYNDIDAYNISFRKMLDNKYINNKWKGLEKLKKNKNEKQLEYLPYYDKYIELTTIKS